MTYVWAVKYVLTPAPKVQSLLIDTEGHIHTVFLGHNHNIHYIFNHISIELFTHELEGGEEVGDGDDNLKK